MHGTTVASKTLSTPLFLVVLVSASGGVVQYCTVQYSTVLYGLARSQGFFAWGFGLGHREVEETATPLSLRPSANTNVSALVRTFPIPPHLKTPLCSWKSLPPIKGVAMGAGASSTRIDEYQKETGMALTEAQKARIADFNQASTVCLCSCVCVPGRDMCYCAKPLPIAMMKDERKARGSAVSSKHRTACMHETHARSRTYVIPHPTGTN